MIKLLTACVAVLLCACADEKPDAELRQTATRFIQAKNKAELRDLIFLPADLDEAKSDRIMRECLTVLSGLDKLPEIKDIEVLGRWARVDLSSPSQELPSLTAINIGGQWQIYWDSAGTLMWGKQKWHTQLSDADWADYKALHKPKTKTVIK